MDPTYVFSFAHPADEAEIRRLLKDCGLPEEDIGPHIRNFLVARRENNIVGTVGLELYEDIVLLRSLAVTESQRGKGLGISLTKEILRYAEHLEAKDVYLLTLTAERFVAKFGFTRLPREKAPKAVRTSKEFTSLCPSTAILMHRAMNRPKSR